MSADRADNHENVIYPALKDGKTVISHRNFWSAIPYGLLDKGIQTATTDRLHQLSVAYGILSMYHQFITPDKTLYLDISADTAVRRLLQRGSNAEMYEKKEKIEKIIAGYTLLLQEFPEEFVIFDAEKSIDDVTDDMIQEIEKNKFKK